MGGDGGTKAVNRSYLRGAGSASTTADAARSNAAVDTALAEEEAARALRTCALTNEALDFERPIVACPYGRLYQKEAAIEALLKRKSNGKQLLLGDHIRGLKDLYVVVFELKDGKPVCPVTGRELGGNKVPAFALLPGKEGSVNVVSQYAMHQLGEAEVFKEYNDAKRKLRLIPPMDVLEQIKADLAASRRTKKKTKKVLREEAAEQGLVESNTYEVGPNKKMKS